MECQHKYVWPDGICTRCGVLETLFPGHTEPVHIMIPRKPAESAMFLLYQQHYKETEKTGPLFTFSGWLEYFRLREHVIDG